MNISEIIKTRRSTRQFSDKLVEKDKLNQIVEAGRYAPSGGNSQTTHFIVIKSKKVLDELSSLVMQEFAEMDYDENTYKSLINSINRARTGEYVFHYDCPILIVVANKIGYGNNMADSSCAIENMMLMANALDLGSCWINQLRWLDGNTAVNSYMKELGLHEDETICGALAVGYPKTADGLPNREPLERKGNEVTVID